MNLLRAIGRAALPRSFRRCLRSAYRDAVFQRAMAKLWERQLGASFKMLGAARPYVELTVP